MPDEEWDAYLDLVCALPCGNAIADRFVSAAHLMTRAAIVNAVFHFLRALGLGWEEAADRAGEMTHLSRSSVARAVRDMERIYAFWDENGYTLPNAGELAASLAHDARHPGGASTDGSPVDGTVGGDGRTPTGS